jgi:hypothetical protein
MGKIRAASRAEESADKADLMVGYISIADNTEDKYRN